MAKRDPEPEPVQEEQLETELPSVGEQLRAAREEKRVSLEDVAAQTRIPLRHLASIESGDWDHLPAPTYTIGFAKNYAAAVGLDRTEIGNQLREEMGGQRFASNAADVFEPADPRRTMPKSLVFGGIAAVIVLVVLMTWLNNRSLEQNPGTAAQQASAPAPAAAPATPAKQPAGGLPAPAPAHGPVVLAATGPAWIQITDQGKTLFEGELQAGQTYTVPQTATAPMLKAGKPEALNVTVGGAAAPQVGPAGKVVTVSLAPESLMKAPVAEPQPRRSSLPAPGPAEAPLTNSAQ